MKICILAKRGKPYIREVVNFTKKFTTDIDLILGEKSELYPKQLHNHEYDILISYLSPWIVKKISLNQTKLYNLNFHPGPPKFPGIGCYNFALYERVKNYGVTAHIMNNKVDTGKIIGVNTFKIDKNETVKSLMDKSYMNMYMLYKTVMKQILVEKTLPKSKAIWKRKPYTRNDFTKLLNIDPTMSSKEINRRIRATEIKGFPGPYIRLHDNIFELKK